MVHPGGRPRTTTPEKDELINLGEDLVKWASEDTDEIRCRYCQWYTKKWLTKQHWELMLQKPEFRCYYEIAQVYLGNRYVDGTINQSIAHRFLRIYCPEVKQIEDKDADEKLERDKKLYDHKQNEESKLTSPLDELNDLRAYKMRKEHEEAQRNDNKPKAE